MCLDKIIQQTLFDVRIKFFRKLVSVRIKKTTRNVLK